MMHQFNSEGTLTLETVSAANVELAETQSGKEAPTGSRYCLALKDGLRHGVGPVRMQPWLQAE